MFVVHINVLLKQTLSNLLPQLWPYPRKNLKMVSLASHDIVITHYIVIQCIFIISLKGFISNGKLKLRNRTKMQTTKQLECT